MIAQVIGVVLICVGLVPAVSAFVEFVKAGGTPMPLAPTQRLVVSEFNRYVRNPMYVGLLLAIVGQALLFASLSVLVYAVLAWMAEVPPVARSVGYLAAAGSGPLRSWLGGSLTSRG